MGLGSIVSSITGGGGGGGGGGGIQFAFPPESEEVKAARKRQAELGLGEVPDIPLRKIAPLEELGPERKVARETALELAKPVDIFSLPEVQGIIQETTAKGNLLTNRLGRILQTAGNITTTSGRDVLGRAVTDVQKSLASSLAPFAQAERERRRGLIPTLETLGLTEQLRKEGFTQDELDELFRQETTETFFPFNVQSPILSSIISNQPSAVPFIPGGGTAGGGLGGLEDIIGPLLASLLSKENIATGLGAFAAFSDRRLKVNIKTITDALDKVTQLDGKTFQFTVGGANSGGVIAQEVGKVFPEIVGEKDGFKTVDYMALIGLLINAVKELNSKIQEN